MPVRMNTIEPILLISPRGMLGRAWAALLESRGIPYTPLSRPDFDITSAASIVKHVTPGARTVVNCSAYTNVDGAEKDEPAACAINGTGVGMLAERCKAVGATLVHYSTDYVFNGTASSPYPVSAKREPLGAYARSKALGEELIEKSGCEHLILRTSWLYAPWGKNFVRTMARLTREKPMLKVVNDQRGRPTSSEHLARVSLQLLEKSARGTLHVTDGGECTWHEFTREIAQQLGHTSCDIQPCASDEYPTPAKRPAYSVMDLSRTEQLVGPMPHWKDNLRDVVARLEPI